MVHFLNYARQFGFLPGGAGEKGRQRRSRGFAVLTYSMYAAGAKSPAALLDSLFPHPLFILPTDDGGKAVTNLESF